MSGHSKWSTIKRQKAATDAARGAVFTKLGNAITIAAREGGGSDPEVNFKLRLLIEKARAANMPKENIERAVLRGCGAGHETAALESVLYEGFAPGGVAILAEGITDNRQRTVSQVKNIFQQKGGHLGSVGSVAYLFTKVGELHLPKLKSADQLLAIVLEVAAQDMEETADEFIVYTQPADFHLVKTELEKRGLEVVSGELAFRPTTTIAVDPQTAPKVVDLLTHLEDLDDIHKVYTNAVFAT